MGSTVTPIGKGDAIDEKWKAMPKGVKAAIQFCAEEYRRNLIDAWEEVNAGVNSAKAEGSISNTLAIKADRAGRGRFRATMTSRVRTPQEPVEIDLHLDKDGQLSLGLPPGWDENPAA